MIPLTPVILLTVTLHLCIIFCHIYSFLFFFHLDVFNSLNPLWPALPLPLAMNDIPYCTFMFLFILIVADLYNNFFSSPGSRPRKSRCTQWQGGNLNIYFSFFLHEQFMPFWRTKHYSIFFSLFFIIFSHGVKLHLTNYCSTIQCQ